MYVLNIPIAYFLAIYMGYGLMGIWFGVQFGSIFAWVSYLLILIFTDWNKLVIDINERIDDDKDKLTAFIS